MIFPHLKTNFLRLVFSKFLVWRNILNEDKNVIYTTPRVDFIIVQDLFEILLKGKCYLESLHDLEQFEGLAKNISLENLQSNNNNTKKDTTNTQKYTSTFTVEKDNACKYCLKHFSSQEACKNHEKFIHNATLIGTVII